MSGFRVEGAGFATGSAKAKPYICLLEWSLGSEGFGRRWWFPFRGPDYKGNPIYYLGGVCCIGVPDVREKQPCCVQWFRVSGFWGYWSLYGWMVLGFRL